MREGAFFAVPFIGDVCHPPELFLEAEGHVADISVVHGVVHCVVIVLLAKHLA